MDAEQTTMRALDLFAGAGGWDDGILPLGIRPLGIELDEAACATREKAGHPTLRGDVAALDPAEFAPCELLIASPPCPTFSAAGKGTGRRDMPTIVQVCDGLLRGDDTRATADVSDPRSMLVVEPLRWALALRPRLIALEQVPTVLPLWQFFAQEFELLGYGTWAGILSAEEYGVPQTRKRAILMAAQGRRPHPPAATHQAYRPGEPAREVATLEGVRRPWVSMADALGWGMTERPFLTVASSRTSGGPDKEKVGGSGARSILYGEREREMVAEAVTSGSSGSRAATTATTGTGTATGIYDAAGNRRSR